MISPPEFSVGTVQSITRVAVSVRLDPQVLDWLRAEGLPLLVEKFKTNLRRRFGEAQQKRILEASLDRERLEAMAVNEYVDLYALVP